MKTTSLLLTFLAAPVFLSSLLAATGGVPATTVIKVPEDFPTIQAAISSAGTSTYIQIAPGDYYEQLSIKGKTGLTLAGEPGAVLHATANLTENLKTWTDARAVIAIVQSIVSVVGLTIEGNRLADLYPAGTFRGIFYVGSSGTVEGCTLRGFRGSTLDAYNGAISLVVWSPQSASVGGQEVSIYSNQFEDNEQSITLAGDDQNQPTQLRTLFTVEGNTIVGFGPISMAVDGVVVYTGAGGVFRGNTLSDHLYTGTGDAYASAIDAFDGLADSRSPARFVPLQPIRFEGNNFRNNSDHLVLLNAANSAVVNNVFEDSATSKSRWGALPISGNGILVSDNDFSGMPSGIVLFGNDPFFSGWPLIPAAVNPVLDNNWFCGVAETITIRNGATGIQQRGSLTCPFRPMLLWEINPISGWPAPALITVRDWHGQQLVLESSANLQDWTPLFTNSMALPILRHEDPDSSKQSQRFYRAVRPPN